MDHHLLKYFYGLGRRLNVNQVEFKNKYLPYIHENTPYKEIDDIEQLNTRIVTDILLTQYYKHLDPEFKGEKNIDILRDFVSEKIIYDVVEKFEKEKPNLQQICDLEADDFNEYSEFMDVIFKNRDDVVNIAFRDTHYTDVSNESMVVKLKDEDTAQTIVNMFRDVAHTRTVNRENNIVHLWNRNNIGIDTIDNDKHLKLNNRRIKQRIKFDKLVNDYENTKIYTAYNNDEEVGRFDLRGVPISKIEEYID